MFHGKLMIRTDNRSLEKTPNILKSVCVSKAAHVFAARMVNRYMDRVVVTNSKIIGALVGRDDFSFVCEFRLNEFAQRLFVNSILTTMLKPHLATAFNRAKHYTLANRAALPFAPRSFGL